MINLSIGAGETIAMIAALGFVMYSGYFIATHTRRQIVIAWLVMGLVFALVLVLAKLIKG